MNGIFDMRLLSGSLMILIPVFLGFYLTRHFQLGWRLWLIGAAGFILSQVGHIPFNGLLNAIFLNGILPAEWVQNAIGQAVVGGLSAGLWEELTRAGVYKWWAKDARSWGKGLLLGAGHGGIESIILAGIVLVTFFYMTSIRGMDLSAIVPAEQVDLARQQIDTYWSVPWSISILGAVERVLTIPCHIAFSILVLQAFIRNRRWWVGAAVFMHALMDAAVVYFGITWQGQPWSPYALEGVLAVFTVISLVLIFVLRTPEPAVENNSQVGQLAPVEGISPDQLDLKVTKEDLDRSRFM